MLPQILGISLFLVGLTAPLPAAAAVAAGGTLKVTFDKDPVVLGAESGMTVTVDVRSRVPLQSLRIAASVGTIIDVRRRSARHWSGRFVPPALHHPQLAIVTAHGRAREGGPLRLGWRALRLWGKVRTKVRTRPGAETTIQIGERVYGPVRADRAGVAAFDAVAPPGVQQGRVGDRWHELGLPHVKQLHGFVHPARVSGASVSTADLYLFGAAQDGSPYSGLAPVVRFTRGSFGELRQLDEGVWRVKLSVPAGPPEELMVTARLPLAAGEEVTISLERKATATATNGGPQPPAEGGLRPLYFWVGLGTSLAALGAGLGTGIKTLTIHAEYMEIYNDPKTSLARKRELKQQGEGMRLATTVLLGVGGAMLAATALLYFFTDFAPPADVGIGPDGARIGLSIPF